MQYEEESLYMAYSSQFGMLAVATVFLASSIPKLFRFRLFVNVISRYQLIPTVLSPFAATAIITAEVIAGASLLLPQYCYPFNCILGVFLLVLFSVAVASSLVRKKKSPCGCMVFGTHSQVSWHILLRNSGLAGFLVASCVRHYTTPLYAVCLLALIIAVACGAHLGNGYRPSAFRRVSRGFSTERSSGTPFRTERTKAVIE